MSDLFTAPAPGFTTAQAQGLAQQHYGLSATALPLTSERDQNFRLQADDGQCWLLKVANAREAAEVIDFENALVRQLEEVAPLLPVPRLLKTLGGKESALVQHPDGQVHHVRLMGWIDGVVLREVTLDSALRRQLGSTLAAMGRGLRGLFHPASGKTLIWDMTRLGELRDKLPFLEDLKVRARCTDFMQHFETDIRPRLKKLRCQVIYNDLNPSNVLVTRDAPHTIAGVVDFGDAIVGPLICDVAVAMSYLITDSDDPLAGAIEFLSAYHSKNPLEDDELQVLLDLIVARAVATLLITAWRATLHPENRDYILRNAAVSQNALVRLSGVDSGMVLARFRRACPTARSESQTIKPASTDSARLIERRNQLLGSAYRLFYNRPVHVVRAEGVWLTDADGQTYLDAYNNVPLVGHCHPEVVAALSSQAAVLNTHTRYLHERVLDYADSLLALFPKPLNRVMFGCSGSEANELALRIARATTGHRGVIATNNAYHGNTIAIAQISPSYANKESPDAWVELIEPPDSYRAGGGEAGCELAEQRFLDDVQSAIERLDERGLKPAALMLDAGFTSDGMYPASSKMLQQAARLIREAGGLYIADEVQAGFARLGHTMWGFGNEGCVPDLVTLGKPIGNGHPLAATVVRQDILDEFAQHTRYFNTFGGNPVSAAVGLAVLRVFDDEGLADNSLQVGGYLHQQLKAVAASQHLVGDVRGSGLFAGVELVEDQDPAKPAGAQCSAVVNAMREQGVLISMIGPHSNTLKIRPPLPFDRGHVDQLIQTLDRCLSRVALAAY